MRLIGALVFSVRSQWALGFAGMETFTLVMWLMIGDSPRGDARAELEPGRVR